MIAGGCSPWDCQKLAATHRYYSILIKFFSRRTLISASNLFHQWNTAEPLLLPLTPFHGTSDMYIYRRHLLLWWGIARQPNLRVFVLESLKCTPVPTRTSGDTRTPALFFCAKCSWGGPFVGHHERVSSSTFYSRKCNCRHFLTCDLSIPARTKFFSRNSFRLAYSHVTSQTGIHEGLELSNDSGDHLSCTTRI